MAVARRCLSQLRCSFCHRHQSRNIKWSPFPVLPHIASPAPSFLPSSKTLHSDGLKVDETQRMLRQVNMESLKRELQQVETPCMDLKDFVRLCHKAGLALCDEEARCFIKSMDEAGVVLLFRNKVYVHPEQIAELVAGVLPPVLLAEDHPRKKEFEQIKKQLEEIEVLADKQVRRYLWTGLICLTVGTGFFIRLTFWELSWDVMEPIAFFTTTSFIIAGYMYFLCTRKDPTYLGLMHSLLSNKKRKLMKRKNFDLQRYRELQKQFNCVPEFLKDEGLHENTSVHA